MFFIQVVRGGQFSGGGSKVSLICEGLLVTVFLSCSRARCQLAESLIQLGEFLTHSLTSLCKMSLSD